MSALVFRRDGLESVPVLSIFILRFATLGEAALSRTFTRPTLGFGLLVSVPG